MNDHVYIYALNDPETGECRYLGKTKYPNTRLRQHVLRSGDKQTHRDYWIQSLLLRELRPILEVIDFVPALEWESWEREYIRAFRALGMNLTNHTDGGGGLSGLVESSREKIKVSTRGRKFSEEHKKKIADALRGKPHTKERRRNISLSRIGIPTGVGRKFSKEHRNNIRLSKLGKKHTLQSRENMRDAQLKRKPATPETLHKLRQAAQNRTWTEEAREKQREANRNRVWTDEARERLRQVALRTPRRRSSNGAFVKLTN